MEPLVARSSTSSNASNISRAVTLLGSVLVALSSGTNYIYSAYAPQLGARLRVSHTQLNVIGLAGNMGVYSSGPVWGHVIDRTGPRIPLVGASICLFVGYLGIKKMYDDGIGNEATVSAMHLVLLIACSFITGSGGVAGLNAAINTTAKSFSSSSRATTTGLVMSGFGLSAFFFSLLAHTFFPGNTSALLLVLAVGTVIPMILGLFIVKPIPLTSSNTYPRERATAEGYDPISSSDSLLFIGEAQVGVGASMSTETDAASAPLLSHQRESSQHHETIGDKDVLPDVHGKQLLLTADFYLLFVIMSICSGTGLMYINNVGSISQALYAKMHPVYDEIEASKWQAAQVSILSVANFLGRALIGVISDFIHTRLRLPRAYCLCIVSSLFIISLATAIAVSSVETLWVATLLLGLAYGSLFGCLPSITIDWFGLAHFSENWGCVAFSPVIGGNLFSLMFGYNLDSHVPENHGASPSMVSRFLSMATLAPRELPSEHQCFDGKACYLGSLQVTLVACIVSLGLSWLAGMRDKRMLKARDASRRE